MPAPRTAAEAFSEPEETSVTDNDSTSFAAFASEPSDIDDDVTFVPTEDDESGEDVEFFDPEELEIYEEVDEEETGEGEEDGGEDTETEYHDANNGSESVSIEVSVDPNAQASGQSGIDVRVVQPQHGRPIAVTRDQIMRLLGQAGLRRLLQQHGFTGSLAPATNDDEPEDETSEDDDISYGFGRRRRRRPATQRNPLPPVPSPAGVELMSSGTFGVDKNWQDELRRRKKRAARILMQRELDSSMEKTRHVNQEMTQGMIPASEADTIIHYNARCYSGQFSDDGNFFFSCAQDFKVRMYDTSNPYDWKYYKTVPYPYGQWTITDATLSPDNKYLAYSSIRSNVCLAVTDPNSSSDPYMLDFADMGPESRRSRRHFQGNTHFGVWSIRFSGDGREIVAGTSDNSVYVYDIEANCSVLRISGHQDHVNAVCFGDVSSPHILYSGSDDSLIKVWDRRSMSDSREAGVFMGHTEGLTYVDSKGDGRYVLSNGKDQSMKLWDLRKMMSTEQSAGIDATQFTTGFDYRYMNYTDADYTPHPHDCSVVTYRGHSVLKTLIRCHFSPPGSTNSRYVYSGSEDGKIHVYNMDATVAGIINVADATYETRPRSGHTDHDLWDGGGGRSTWKTCVRDASWHPYVPVMAATSWNGWGMSTGTCSIHSWNDTSIDDESDIPVGMRVNHKLEPDERYYNGPARTASTSRQRRGLRTQAVTRRADEDDEEGDW